MITFTLHPRLISCFLILSSLYCLVPNCFRCSPPPALYCCCLPSPFISSLLMSSPISKTLKIYRWGFGKERDIWSNERDKESCKVRLFYTWLLNFEQKILKEITLWLGSKNSTHYKEHGCEWVFPWTIVFESLLLIYILLCSYDLLNAIMKTLPRCLLLCVTVIEEFYPHTHTHTHRSKWMVWGKNWLKEEKESSKE